MPARIHNRTILLIGASGGIGRAVADALLRSGARKVIGAATRPPPARPGFVPESVDVTDVGSVRALAHRQANAEISCVVYCAGVNWNAPLFTDDLPDKARQEMQVNYFGLLNVAQTFTPLLEQQPDAMLVVLLSFLSHVSVPAMASYCASKAAAHSLTDALRQELRPRGITVCGVYPTVVDTTMSRDFPGEKLAPEALACEIVEAMRAGQDELFPGPAREAYRQLAIARAAPAGLP